MKPIRQLMGFLRTAEGRTRFWLWVFCWLTCLCVQTGTLGEVNTTERLKATRWLWQEVPQADHPGWMVRGRDGKDFVTYGLGQSLVMFPADLVAGSLERFIGPPRLKEKLREFVVAVLTFPPLCATAALMAYLVLLEAGFERPLWVVGQRFESLWDGIRGREHSNPDGRPFHRVCLAPAVASREFPRLAWVAWGGWLGVVGLAVIAALRLFKTTVGEGPFTTTKQRSHVSEGNRGGRGCRGVVVVQTVCDRRGGSLPRSNGTK